MTVTPPTIGQEDWGDDLNAYLIDLEERIAANVARIEALEAQPEYVYNSYAWQFSSSAPPATGNQVRLDNTDPAQVTVIDIRKVDSDGGDRTTVFQQLTPGDQVMIQDWDDATQLYRYSVIGPTMIGATNVTIPVVWVSGAGTVPNAKVSVAFLVSLIV